MLKNNIVGGTFVQRTALKDFQGGLKKERPDLIQSLKETIKQKGFDAPIYLRYEHDNLILDGHQRLKALNELASEGELLPADNIPCIYIKADTLEQAKEKVVEYNTRFSEMDRKEFAARVEGLEVELLPLGEFGITPLDVALQPLEIEKKSLTEEFGVPPFSVLDTKQGYRIQRKQERLALGIKSNVGREQTETTGSTQMGIPGYYNFKEKTEKKLGRKLTDKEFQEEYLIDYYDPETANTAITEEGGMLSIFDPVLCEICYKRFCTPGGTIIDPFAGGSVRGMVAAKLGYNYYGVDLSEKQVKANEKQAFDMADKLGNRYGPKRLCGNSTEINKILEHTEADMIFSCPPYVDLEKYSDNPEDLSNMEYQTFLSNYTEIITQTLSLLKDNRFAVFVVGEVRDRKTGFYYPFVEDTKRIFRENGADFYNDIILLNQLGTVPLRTKKQFYAGRKVGKVHQNILVFYKGAPKKIKETFKDVVISGFSEENLA